ncbi:MAG TPA: YtxH domain-containing protein [Candidatus Saccharimonadales bacterium]|jgi:gas vesicle protein
MNGKAKRIALGTIVAGAVGYVAGILTAPKSGSDTRSSIRSVRDSSIAKAEKQLKQLHTELNHLLGEAESKIKHDEKHSSRQKHEVALEGEIVHRASRTRQKAREILSALHDGNANDHDLDTAVSEASKAIKAMKTYLKKK